MSKRPVCIDDLRSLKIPSDPQPRPGGSEIAFTYKFHEGNQAFFRLAAFDPASDGVRDLTPRKQSCSSPRWCPDGSALAFVSDREEGVSQIFLLPMSGGEAQPLTQLPEGSLGAFKWSPNGKWIAASFRERALERTKSAVKERADQHASDLPWVLDDIQYRLDGDGYFGGDRYRLILIDTSTGDHRTLCADAADGSYSFDWSPDSDRLAVIHTRSHRPFFTPPDDIVRILSLDGNDETLDYLPAGSKDAVAWSPDGKHLAFAGSLDLEDPWGTRNTRLFLVDLSGKAWKGLTDESEYDLSVATLSDSAEAGYGAKVVWLGNDEILVQIGWQGSSHPATVNLAGEIAFLTVGDRLVVGGGLDAGQSRLGIMTTDPLSPPEVGVLDLASGKEVSTQLNHDWKAEVEIRVPQAVWLDSTPNKDGSPSKLHVWRIDPATPNGATVIEIHGGPHTQYGWTFFHEFQVLAAAGYTVFYSNPRGSKGYGEGFCHEIHGDWGHKDWEDIETLTQHVKDSPGLDPSRIAVMGGSYGGYMTNWAVGHSKAYKTSITDRCVSNLVSMSGNSDFPFNHDAYFKGSAYGDLESIRELWRQSPIAYFDQVETPMLIIHSEGDLRCNVEQGEQVFTALQEKGIRSRFVRYPRNSSHGLSRSGPIDLRIHRLQQIVRWYAETL